MITSQWDPYPYGNINDNLNQDLVLILIIDDPKGESRPQITEQKLYTYFSKCIIFAKH